MPSYRISVVIPTYRRCASLRRLLLALTRQTLSPEEFEVVVSIDGSEDGTYEMATGFPAAYRLLVLWQPNEGRARACNAGVRASSGELVVLLDDDMEPPADFLTAHLREHESGFDTCVVGAAPIRTDETSSPVRRFLARVYEQNITRMSLPEYRLELRDLYSGNLSIRRETFLRVGLFDEDFREYGSEDRDLFLRMTEAGISIAYSAKAFAYQHYEKELAALAKDRAAAGRTAVLLVQKHPAAYEATLGKKYRQCSLRWRYLRAMLLGMGRMWEGMPGLILSLVDGLARVWPASFQFFGPEALDYVFWFSACSALREQRNQKGLSADMCSDSSRHPAPPTIGS